jgi:hypothetical protein
MDRKDLQPQHDGGSSITQSSVGASRDGPGRPSKPYIDGAKAGSGGATPSKQAIAAGPKSGTEGR